jgi:hypothetical protein
MNLALSVVVILIFLLPFYTFKISLFWGKNPRVDNKFTFLEELLLLSIFSLTIHFIFISLISNEIRFDIIFQLLSAKVEEIKTITTNAELESIFLKFWTYFIILLLILFILGRLIRIIIKYYGLDNKYHFLRLYNTWYYYFNGYFLDDLGDENNNPDSLNFSRFQFYDFVWIDILVNLNEGSTLYSGFLWDYECKGEDLNRLYVYNATRTDLRDQVENNGHIVHGDNLGTEIEIPGSIIIIPYSEVKNINLTFFNLEELEGELEEELKDIEQGDKEIFKIVK